MNGRTGLVLAAVISYLPSAVLADTLSLPQKQATYRPSGWVVTGEVCGALAGGLAGGLGLGAVGFVIGGSSAEFQGGTASAALACGSVGYAVGTALGAWAVGSLARQDGRAGGAFLGAAAGLVVGGGLAALGGATRFYPLIGLAFVAPPAGAVIGYNSWRPRLLPRRCTAALARDGSLWIGVGEFAGAAVLGGALAAPFVQYWSDYPDNSPVRVGAALVGGAAGAGIGAWGVGRLAHRNGRLVGSLLGSAAGLALALAVGSASENGWHTTLLAFTLAPAGAVIGHNLSRPKEGGRHSFNDRLGLPGLAVRQGRLPDGAELTVYDARLVTVRF